MIINNLDYDQAWRSAAKNKLINETLHFPTLNLATVLYDTGGFSFLITTNAKKKANEKETLRKVLFCEEVVGVFDTSDKNSLPFLDDLFSKISIFRFYRFFTSPILFTGTCNQFNFV